MQKQKSESVNLGGGMDFLSGSRAQKAILAAAAHMAEVVGSTLGPKGKNVAIAHPMFPMPVVINDGATIAKRMSSRDAYTDIGIQVIKQASVRTAEEAGDGTTTSIILANAMLQAFAKAVAPGFSWGFIRRKPRRISPSQLKNGMDDALALVQEIIRDMATKVSTEDGSLEQVATISANNDKQLGALIASAFRIAGGAAGAVSVEGSVAGKTEVETVPGFRLGHGYLTNLFINNPSRAEATFQDAWVFIAERRFSGIQEILPILDLANKGGRPLVMIVSEMTGTALDVTVRNNMEGKIRVAVVKMPFTDGPEGRPTFQDLAAWSGAKFYGSEGGFSPDHVKVTDFGNVHSVQVRKNEAIFSGVDEDHTIKNVSARLTQLEDEAAGLSKKGIPPEDPAWRSLDLRRGNLRGKAAVLHISAPTQSDLQEKLARVDDAVRASRTALEAGVVPGGAMAYLYAQAKMRLMGLGISNKRISSTQGEDFWLGFGLVVGALSAPWHMLIRNSGAKKSQVDKVMGDTNHLTIAVILKNSQPGIPIQVTDLFGFDALDGNTKMMAASGIVDPVKVLNKALENAVSVVHILANTDHLLIDSPSPMAGMR
jgi:chaperonin GroEL